MCSVTLLYTGSTEDLIARSQKAFAKAGGTFTGNINSAEGTMELKEPVHIVGNYILGHHNIYVTITQKPPIFSCAMAGVRFGQLTGTFPVEVAPQAAFATSRAQHTEDIFPHLNVAHQIAARATTIMGCISVLEMVQVCYTIFNDEVKITAELKSQFGDAPMGGATLTAKDSTTTLSGSSGKTRAEVTVSIDFKTLVLKICGKRCTPTEGCSSGCISINL